MDTIFNRARITDGTTVSIAVAGGRIASIGTDAIEAPARVERVDLDGALVVPGLIDGHIHLDKTFVGDRWRPHRPCTSGFDVRERVTFEKELLADSAPAETRAASLIELAVSHGTTHMRCHVDVDSTVGLRNLETVRAARERYRDCVSIEIVAFPQSGIMTNPGTAELLDAAVREGADLVGGLDPAGFDKDIDGHLGVVFGIAERRDVGIDLHLHDPDALGISELEAIAERTKALGMQGRVAVSHAYALGDVPIDTVKRTAAKLADAGVAIMTNAPGNRAFPPVLALRDEGVTVFLGNDNIQDSWWPYGDADMLERTMIVGYRSGFVTDDELEIAFDLASASAARVLRLPDYGLVVGARADFVALDARHVPEAVVTRPATRSVYKSGRLVACNGRFADRELAHGMHAH
jgi:cytosine/adenosine deaminase-related metal-dependent hydrolase